MEPSLRAHDPLAQDWVTGALLLALIVLAAINRNAPRKWRMLLQAGFRMRMGRQTLREEMDVQDRNFLGLVVIGIAILALFAWQAVHILGFGAATTYPALLGLLVGVIVAQGILTRILAGLARTEAGATEYLYTGSLLFTLLGLLMQPLVALIAFRAEWRWPLVVCGCALTVIALLYRWVRGVWIGLGEGIPARYIILYFCAAEAAPLLLAIHALRPPIITTSHL